MTIYLNFCRMADLDCRLEEIRQRFRSLLLSRDDTRMFRYRTSQHLMEGFLNNCIEKNLMRFDEDQEDSTWICVYAKATYTNMRLLRVLKFLTVCS